MSKAKERTDRADRVKEVLDAITPGDRQIVKDKAKKMFKAILRHPDEKAISAFFEYKNALEMATGKTGIKNFNPFDITGVLTVLYMDKEENYNAIMDFVSQVVKLLKI